MSTMVMTITMRLGCRWVVATSLTITITFRYDYKRTIKSYTTQFLPQKQLQIPISMLVNASKTLIDFHQVPGIPDIW